jgi:hypothetical protein
VSVVVRVVVWAGATGGLVADDYGGRRTGLDIDRAHQ